MECIYCAGSTQVANSRPQKRLHQVWRRRRCKACAAVFTSLEAADLGSSLVVQAATGDYEPFSRDELFMSVVRALGHRTDAVAAAGALTATIIASLYQSPETAVIRAAAIAIAAHKALQAFDSAAGVQYGAYHKALL